MKSTTIYRDAENERDLKKDNTTSVSYFRGLTEQITGEIDLDRHGNHLLRLLLHEFHVKKESDVLTF